jgi:DNA-binding FadR family transcriptional regulator
MDFLEVEQTRLAIPSALKTDKRLRLHGAIARELGRAIVSGRYRSGAFLPDEITSSKNLAVSRTTYREAIRILAAKGLIESKPKVGTKVTTKNKWHVLDPDLMFWLFEAGQGKKMADHLFELRNIVEPAAAALAATRRTEAQLSAMHQALECMRRHTPGASRQAETAFRLAILQATDNPFLFSLCCGFFTAPTTATLYKQRGRPQRCNPIRDSVQVLKAIANQDPPKAHAAMRKLIRHARTSCAFTQPS